MSEWVKRHPCPHCGGEVVANGGYDMDGREAWGGNCTKCGRGFGEAEDEAPTTDRETASDAI